MTTTTCERCEAWGRSGRVATRRLTYRWSGDDPAWPDREAWRCGLCAQILRAYALITSDEPVERGPREVERRRAQSTRTHVTLFDRGRDDPERVRARKEGYKWLRWETICEEHGSVCSHPTRALARSFLAAPEEWCEECREELERG